MPVAQKYSSQLERIKHNVLSAHTYFKENVSRYHKFRKYVFQKSIDETQETILNDQGKPVIEFNILIAYLSRLFGEFAKHEPSIAIQAARGIPIDPLILEIIENHIRHVNYEANKNSCDYEVYRDILTGGFSVLKVYVDWESSMSFDRVIRKERVFDPTLTGFDPLARYSHKGDGQFSFELFPMTYEDFKRDYPGIDISKVSFTRSIEGFNWSYISNEDNQILLLGEYFEKKKRRKKIVKLANGRVMTDRNYQKLEAWWQQEGFLEQIPKPIGKPRMSDIETICRHLLIESEIFDYEETDYCYLPHVFVDGDSIILQEGTSNNTYQFTKPYVFHAKGIQDLKNFAGQCLGNYLDNMIQHKFIVKKEAIPQEEDYQEALKDMQHARTVVVNAYSENNPDKPIPEPIREVQNLPAPPEVMGAFSSADQMTQMILGTFDAALGVNDNQLSGVAIIEAATQSNAVAFPYLKGYLQAETQCANIIADLMPKYLKNTKILPMIDKEGNKSTINVNGKNEDGTNQPKIDYDEKAISVEIKAGVNYTIAKNKALTQIFAMMQASPTAAEFFSTEGFPIILDNMEFHGSDIAKEKAEKWLQQKQSQPPQPSPDQLKYQTEMASLQQKSQESYMKQQMHQSQMQLDIMKLQQDYAKLMHNLQLSKDENYRENVRAAVDHHLKIRDAELKEKQHDHKQNIDHHNSIRESVKLHNDLNNPVGVE